MALKCPGNVFWFRKENRARELINLFKLNEISGDMGDKDKIVISRLIRKMSVRIPINIGSFTSAGTDFTGFTHYPGSVWIHLFCFFYSALIKIHFLSLPCVY